MKADKLPSALWWGVGGVGYLFTLCEWGEQNRSKAPRRRAGAKRKPAERGRCTVLWGGERWNEAPGGGREKSKVHYG